jgi:hypothetical protein
MYPIIYRNSGLTETDCSQFHAPPVVTQAELVEVGICVQETLEEGICGNGIATTGEECDQADLRGTTCGELGFEAGFLACSPECRLDASGCSNCGDRVCNGGNGEDCFTCPEDCKGAQCRPRRQGHSQRHCTSGSPHRGCR